MKSVLTAAVIVLGVCLLTPCVVLAQTAPPKAGPVEIMPVTEIRPGMQATAWTVFSGMEREAVPIEIVGLMKNAWGPKQDIILGKMGGKAQRTNVAGGMSGSPVYIDGKLIGAVSTRLSVFSPDAICGITPIEAMLEVSEFDTSVPSEARTPERLLARLISGEAPAEGAARVSAGSDPRLPDRSPVMVPIKTPLTFSGFHQNVLDVFAPVFDQLGVAPVQGGGGSTVMDTKPAEGWQTSLQPGDAVSAVLMSGDMSVTGMGTVTYNDGKRVLAFGHSLFNMGPVNMPMSKAEVLMVLASSYQPNKIGNSTEIVGALRQDRHSAIMGVLGEESPTIPVNVKVRDFDSNDQVVREKEFHFQVFVHQQWTPYLMTISLYNTISGLNEFAEETTYRLSGEVDVDGQPSLSLSTMQTTSELPLPAPLLLSTWWGERFTRLFVTPGERPKLTRVNATLDLLPKRRVATIESAWAALSEVEPGSEVPVKVFLKPYRGDRIEREITVKIPAGLPEGSHKILLSGADVLNRLQQTAAQLNRRMELPQAVSLINQERSNNRLYVSLVQSRPTIYYEDKALPSLPASVANVMQTSRRGNRQFLVGAESALEQESIPFDLVIEGSYSLPIKVR